MNENLLSLCRECDSKKENEKYRKVDKHSHEHTLKNVKFDFNLF